MTLALLFVFSILPVFLFASKVEAATPWYNEAWSFRKKLTIDNTKVSGSSNITNFPVYISLASDADLSEHAQSDGDDLLFTSVDGTTKLSHEIELYTTGTGLLQAWVKIPTLSYNVDTEIYIYYGNPVVGSQQNVTDVWSNGFSMVQHLDENPAVIDQQDSTVNNNDAVDNGSMDGSDVVTGKLGSAIDFDGTDDFLQVSANATLNTTQTIPWTFSGWINADTLNSPVIIGNQRNVSNLRITGLLMNSHYVGVQNVGTQSANAATSFSTSTWYYVVGVYNPNSIYIYVNGVEDATPVTRTSSETTANTGPYYIGVLYNGANLLNGRLDEVRMSSVARSADWIATEYNNQNSPGTFYSLDSEEIVESTRGGTAPSTIEFQGKIVHKAAGSNQIEGGNLEAGNPACIVDGPSNDTCDFRIRIWSDATDTTTTSGTGSLVFEQTFTNVEIGEYTGIFNLDINDCDGAGSASQPYAASDWGTSVDDCTVIDDSDDDLYPGIDFSNGLYWSELSFAPAGSGSYTEVFSRKSISTVPYALYANRAGSVEGFTSSSSFVKFNQSTVQESTTTNNTIINIDENGAESPDLVDIKVAGSSVLKVLNTGVAEISGNLGVGLTSPTSKLEVTNTSSSQSAVKINQQVNYWVKQIDFTSDTGLLRTLGTSNDGSIIFGGQLTSASIDQYVSKVSSAGTFEWGTSIDGSSTDTGTSVATTTDGGAAIVGNSTSFTGTQDTLVSKVDKDGNLLWSATYGGAGSENSQGIIQDSNGYLVSVGQTDTFNGTADGQITIMNQQGNIIDSVYLTGSSSTEQMLRVLEYPDGGYVLIGSTNDAVGSGGDDGWVTKLNPDLTLDWARVIGGGSTDQLREGTIAPDGSITLVGNTSSFGAGGQDISVMNYSADGTLNWTNIIGGTGTEGVNSISKYEGGYLVGASTTSYGSGGTDGYLLKLTSAGAVDWVRTVGAGSTDVLNDAYPHPDGSIMITGYFNSNEMLIGKLDANGDCGSCSLITTPASPSETTGGTSSSFTPTLATAFTSSTAQSATALSEGSLVDQCTATGTVNVLDIGATGSTRLNSQLTVGGDIYADTIYGKEVRLSNFDLAEEYIVEDRNIKAGDVIKLKKEATDNRTIEKANGRYDSEVIGVVSTAPGIYLRDWNSNNKNGRPVALAGRVPVKVSTENGEIKRGDYLTVSSEGGYAMKATEPGYIIGRAMEDLKQEGNSETVDQLVEVIEQREGGEEYAEEVIGEELITTDEVQRETAQSTKDITKGRIMMYVDLGYVGEQVYRERETTMKALEINRYELENGSRLFELVEDSNLTKLKLNIDELIIAGSVEIEGDLDVKGIITGRRIETDQLSVGSVEIAEGSGVSGEVEIPAGERSIFVENTKVKFDSVVLITFKNKYRRYGITEKREGEGFALELDAAVEENIKFDYVVIN